MMEETEITTVDSHTGGEPTRLVTDGLPPIPGESMADKVSYFGQHLDAFRTALMHEPRGHRDLVGAVLVPATRPDADVGVFYMDRRPMLGRVIGWLWRSPPSGVLTRG